MTPPLDNGDSHTAWRIAIAAIFALAGGIVRQITHGKTMTLARYLGGGLVGMFAGMIVFCGCQYFGLSEWAASALSGLGGYSSEQLLDALNRRLQDRITKDPP